jgi:hypothetical protein
MKLLLAAVAILPWSGLAPHVLSGGDPGDLHLAVIPERDCPVPR